jgi:hypothetical protein
MNEHERGSLCGRYSAESPVGPDLSLTSIRHVRPPIARAGQAGSSITTHFTGWLVSPARALHACIKRGNRTLRGEPGAKRSDLAAQLYSRRRGSDLPILGGIVGYPEVIQKKGF